MKHELLSVNFSFGIYREWKVEGVDERRETRNLNFFVLLFKRLVWFFWDSIFCEMFFPMRFMKDLEKFYFLVFNTCM